jgi:hypothetical protein
LCLLTDKRVTREREKNTSQREEYYILESISIEEYITNGPRTEQSRANLFFFSVKVKCGKSLPEASPQREELGLYTLNFNHKGELKGKNSKRTYIFNTFTCA